MTTLLAGHPNNHAVTPSNGRTLVLSILPGLPLGTTKLHTRWILEALPGERGVRAGIRQLMNIKNEGNYISITQHAFMAYSKTIWFVCVRTHAHTHKHIAGLAEWKILELRNLCHLHQELETSLYIVNITPTHSFLHRSLDSYTAVLTAEKKINLLHWTFPSIVSYF